MSIPYWDEDRWGEASWPDQLIERLGVQDLDIALFSYGPGVATWDGDTTWGGGLWATREWKDILIEVLDAQYAWGADRALGVLTVASGGSVSLNTYDPDGTLDPTNPSSPFAYDLFPGSYIRLAYKGTPIFIGILDTINYSQQNKGGYLGGTDAVGVLSNVKVVVPANPPTTLRALTRVLIAAAGLKYVRCEDDPPNGDPLVGKLEVSEEGDVALWSAISEAAIDALNYAWVGPDLLVHFWSHGDPIDRGLTLGLSGIPLLEVVGQSTSDGIFNHILARDTTGTVYTTSSPDSISRFGKKTIDRSKRRIPNAITWADRVLADRDFASLEYVSLQIIPSEPVHVQQLTGMVGMEVVRIRTDLTEPHISADVRAIGLQMKVTPEGWDGAVLGYISSNEWADNLTPPPIPPTTTTVPQMVGDQLTVAQPKAQAAGLRVTTSEAVSTKPVGEVTSQNPVAGTSVAIGSAVALVIAKAAAPTTSTVPAITGRAEASALSAISAAGLTAGTRSTATSSSPAGTVIAQSPAAGTIVAMNSAVAYTVSTGPTVVTRTTTSTKVARVALTDTGQKYGAGAETASPAGAYSGWENRVLIGLTADFTGAVAVDKAILRLRTSTQDNVAFGSNPKIKVQRITGTWSEGSSGSPSSSNAVVWPGPARTSTGEVVKSVTRSQDTTVDIDVTALVRAWAPSAAGGSGIANNGLALLGYVETNSSYTTEFKTDDAASNRPQLILTLQTA